MTRPLKCLIIDDEPLARQLIESYVAKTPGLNLEGAFESAAEAVKSVMSGDIDIIFLDINMPTLNGIEFASLIPERTRIIYITAYEQYALQGFKVNALDYLLKPVSYEEFCKAVKKAFDWHAMHDAYEISPKGESETLTVKTDCRLIQMRLDSIRYVEVRKDRVIFFRAEGEPVSTLMSLNEIERLLPADRFMRVHRSFIVNLRQIEVVERNRIVFGNEYIPIADSKRDEFLARLR